ncbi:polysaccharide lyase family 8 super-sandwich domain-containing protein [Endozoicomonas atrinae]|uniref:polysaccharide lyase family 8 super-sandwich domain-containing protein n=1 Tax=Endozoicomonas atrinae TaxID=1333660 RepID=UPI000824EC95|nr:polysaccharide lyase family 8 super-sandwich domain-containing protein [Endozoicomonas atrinae]
MIISYRLHQTGNLTSRLKSVINIKTITLLCSFMLLSGCKSSASSDEASGPARTPPVITIIGDQYPEILINTVYSDLGATASDTVDGILTGNIITENPVDSSTPGQYSVTYQVTNSANQTTTAVRSVTVNDPSDQEDIKDEAVFADFFDIKTNSPEGSKVTGRINLLRNYRALGSWNTSPESVSEDYRFAIIEDKSNGMFTLDTVRDVAGRRIFGEFSVAPGHTAQTGSHPIRVELRHDSVVKARFTVTIHAVDKTQWETYFGKLTEFAMSESRLWGRNELVYGDPELESILSQIESNNGQFTDLHIYSMESLEDLLNFHASENIKAFETAGKRIGSLGYALKELDTSTSQYTEKRNRLIQAILKSFNAYASLVPVREFDDFSVNASPNGISYNDRTHQWRFTDPVTLPLILAFESLWEDAQSGSSEAQQFLYNIHHFFQIAFALPYKHRNDLEFYPSTELYTRYFLEKDLRQSPGAWSDANRHHRIRGWAAMAGLWKDYNRPLTDKLWWYDDYQPFAEETVSILNEWQPKGALSDLKVWLDTNLTEGFTVGNAGLLPDGTISHHTGTRQDLAMLAYGYEWLATTPMKVASLLKETQWAVNSKTIDHSAEFVLKSLQPVIYQNGHDYQAVGRSFISDAVKNFGSSRVAGDINTILSGAPADTKLTYKEQLLTFQNNLLQQSHESSGSFPFWNSEFLVHRRASTDEGGAWYSSFRSQSIRVRGAESFGSDPGYYNGSGILQVKVNGDEYNDARYDWDWHLQPGLTEEWRTDPLPVQSEDASNGFSDEVLSGMLSDHQNSIASFKYSSEASYASAKADKSAFFSDKGVFAIGDHVRRDVKDGKFASDGRNPIVTTIDQALWSGDLSYNTGSGTIITPVGSNQNLKLTITSPAWFHQNGKGYLIWPDADGRTELNVVTGTEVEDTYQSVNKGTPIYSLMINHGVNPDHNSDNYQYLVLPNVSRSEMPGLLEYYSDSSNFERISHNEIYGARWIINGKQLIQLAFQKAGTVTLSDGKTVSIDKPALVQLHEGDENWAVAISDPTHHSRDEDPDSRGEFRVFLKPGQNVVNVDISWALKAGTYQYLTQGYQQQYLPGQEILVSTSADNTRLTAHLPDGTDDVAYGLKEEMFSGMTAVVHIPIP